MEAFSVPDQLAIAKDVERMLRDYGATNADVASIYSEIDKWHARDLAAPIQQAARRKLEAHSRELHIAVNERFGSPITDNEGFDRESRIANEPLRHIFQLKDLLSLPLPTWLEEIERRVAAMPLPDRLRLELTTEIAGHMHRLRLWINDRDYTPEPQVTSD